MAMPSSEFTDTDTEHHSLITIIKPKKGWQVVDIKELFRYRDLLLFFVYRDIKVLYKQTVLGFAWAIINPVFNMLVFNFIGKMGRLAPGNVPYLPFLYVGLIPWTYFSNSVNMSSQSLITSSQILTKVYFPRLVIPLTPVISKLVDFAISFSVLIVLFIVYSNQITINLNILFLPLLIVLMVIAASGMGLWFSAMAIQYRDIKYAITFLTQILFFLTPIMYPISKFDSFGPVFKFCYSLYPMTGIEEGFRACLLGIGPMPWNLLLIGTASSIFIFVSGAFYFARMEKVFADVA